MANVIINDEHLTAIANAIREKNGTENQYKPRKMAQAILELEAGGGGVTEMTFSEAGYFTYRGVWDEFIQNYPQAIRFKNVGNADYAFASSNLNDVSSLRFLYRNGDETIYTNFEGMFDGASSMEHIFGVEVDETESFAPISVQSTRYMFRNMTALKDIPESWANEYFDYSSLQRSDYIFSGCSSLRHIPPNFLKNLWSRTSSNRASQFYNYGLNGCFALDRVDKLPVGERSFTSDIFNYGFLFLHRVNGITFHMPNKAPAIANWTNQYIYLNDQIGYCSSWTDVSAFGGSIPDGYEVTDDITYNELKNTEYWWTRDEAYSRYNHDSAVETINSLPDTSAAGGNNTILFNSAAGAKTDGGSIGTLTEEEIAVAAAKGWTVSLT